MLSEIQVFLRLGFEHIADPRGYDHILFVIALCAGHEFRHWRRILILVTAFTVGHSITLALATLRLVVIDDALVEFLIPVTILLTGIVNIATSSPGSGGPPTSRGTQFFKYLLALGFGLIHGLGFSNFLRSLLGAEEGIALPLLSFNIGLELGQILIVVAVLLVTTVLVGLAKMRRHDWTLVLSGATSGVATILIVEQLLTWYSNVS